MEIKIKNKDNLIDATIEVVDGVMIVLPKEEKVDITKFKDGDVITCGHHDCGGFQWTAILRGEIEYISDNMFIDDYCSFDCNGMFLDHNSGSDSATWVRYATEEEKQKLFDRLKEEGLEWDAEKKELVKLRWKPKVNEVYYYPSMKPLKGRVMSIPKEEKNTELLFDKNIIDAGWVFRTKEECEQFCKRLNKAIELVKP